MTSDLPPLSETHPTLSAAIEINHGIWHLEMTQEFTIDKAEHEGVKRLYCHYMAEVERLKKEIIDAQTIIERWEYIYPLDRKASYNDGVREGERRAMQRVKEVYAKFACRNKDFCSANRVYCSWCDFGKELGLSDKDDEVQP